MNLFKKIKRAWRHFNCKHHNTLMHWHDNAGWNIVICRRCGRAWIFTDGGNQEESFECALNQHC